MTAPVQDAFVLFGDSITQMGWMEGGLCQRLAEKYVRKLDVVNRGFSGYTTAWALPVFKQLLPSQNESPYVQNVRILTIWLGANDAVLPGFRQHVPLPTYTANLHTLVRLARTASPSTRILLLTPPLCHVAQRRAELLKSVPPWEELGEDNRKLEVVAQYADATRAVAREEEGVVLVDVWKAMWDAAGRDEENLRPFLSDGLHLTAKGYSVVYDELVKTIKEKLPELHYDNLKQVFVNHDKIDLDNLEASLTKRTVTM